MEVGLGGMQGGRGGEGTCIERGEKIGRRRGRIRDADLCQGAEIVEAAVSPTRTENSGPGQEYQDRNLVVLEWDVRWQSLASLVHKYQSSKGFTEETTTYVGDSIILPRHFEERKSIGRRYLYHTSVLQIP